MKKFLGLVLFLGACTAVAEGPTTSEPTVPASGQTGSDEPRSEFVDPPAVPDGPLDPAIDNEIGGLIVSAAQERFDSEALDTAQSACAGYSST